MGSKIFLDANILLDFFLQRPGHEKIKEIFELIEDEKVQAFITPTIIHIAGYFLVKEYGKKEARNLLITLLTNVQAIDAPHEITLLALNSKIDDIEDALQYYASIHNEINYFISRDKRLKKEAIAALPVLTPDEFITEFL
ncbi:type II toxin-antitoxin system VapC family toxin [Pinibacter aurantiacus]|uniref:PIN domain-containing protein n=1 Tax=Pinibacter aurantiacus TaxID=2851599 RepID=A0A9E2SBL2_9BACT|nr:PIN domain-containing protein [Pinibacter aurantiacus]MBV4359531.1 PIN domain-containing protein [Pinibacter aurantiacus]